MATSRTKKTRLKGKARKKARAVPLPSRRKRPASSVKSGVGSAAGPKKRSAARSPSRSTTGTLPTKWKKDPKSRPRTIRKLEKVLVALLEHGIIETACNEEKVSKATFYAIHSQYADFRLQVDEAISLASKAIERVGMACARKAEEDPKYQTSLIFALKAKCGWKDGRLLEVSGPGGGPIETRAIDLSDAELEAIAYGDDGDSDGKETG